MDSRLRFRWPISLHLPTVLLALCLLQSSTASGATPSAEIQAILIGGVAQPEMTDVTKLEIKRVEDGRLESGKIGTLLFAGDEIRTGSGVEVNLRFSGSNALIEVFVLEQSRASIGSLFSWYGSFLIRGLGIFDTRTQYVRLGKRGTEFKLDVYENGDVDLRVLYGAVDVEKGEFQPGAHAVEGGPDEHDVFIAASYSKPAQVKSVIGRQTVRITRSNPIPEPRLLAESEVVELVDRTNSLLLATMPYSRPANVLPSTFLASNDPVEDKSRADAAFKAARLKAVMEPSVKNTVALGDAFKDLGSGERATMEYAHAAKEAPGLRRSPNFLIGQAEAFRLSRDYTRAEETLNRARGVMAPSVSKSTQFRLQVAAGNISYDKGVASVNKKKNYEANEHFLASRAAYERAGELVPTDDISGGSSMYVFRSAQKNVDLALKSDPTADGHTALNGTYDGELSFAAGAEGPAVLVVTGTRFTLTTKKISLSGRVDPGRKTATGAQTFRFVFDSGVALPAVELQATCADAKSLVLRSDPNEKMKFQFLAQPRQSALTCLQPMKKAQHSIQPK